MYVTGLHCQTKCIGYQPANRRTDNNIAIAVAIGAAHAFYFITKKIGGVAQQPARSSLQAGADGSIDP
jgi:hypothetical protein